MAVGSVWFGTGRNGFQGGIVAAGNGTVDFLEHKTVNEECIAFLSSCQRAYLAWRFSDGCIEIQEAYYELMLHAEDDICVRFGPDGEKHSISKGQVIYVLEGNYRRKDDEPCLI